MVVSAQTPAEPDCSDIDLPLVKVQGDFVGYSPDEVDNQVESVEAVMAIDHQDN